MSLLGDRVINTVEFLFSPEFPAYNEQLGGPRAVLEGPHPQAEVQRERLTLATTAPSAVTMKPSSPITFTVLLALEILTPWTAEGTSTEKVKSGACPFRPHGLCLVYEPHECLNDWECPKDQKCCPSICSNKCLDPVDPSEQGEETESWKRGPERFQLEDTHLGEVAGSRGGGGGAAGQPLSHSFS
uniref:WAP domain-containing protein n=1 Tax=Felis catus TaxID=9685 RepID=A0ABI7Y4S6_FELCA